MAATPVLVGRDDVLAAALGALTVPPSLVLVEGAAGIGKTRLLQECLVAAPLRERTVLVAACPPLREPFPLGPVVDGLCRLRQQVDALTLSPLAGALRPLFPEWATELPPELEPLDDPKATRHRLFRALTELVTRLGVDVVAVEDAHWADAATLEWLLTLCASGSLEQGAGMSVVVTYRPLEVPAGSLLSRLTSWSPAGVTRLSLTLEPLDAEQTRQLVASMFGTDQVSERFANFLHEHTDGLPLAVQEAVLLLRDRHDIVCRGGAWSRRVLEELRVPQTVRDSVLERVGRLDNDARAVLAAASVLAAPADESLLAGVAELDEQAGRAGVGAALATGLLREVTAEGIVFRHALDAKAVGEAIPAPERRRLHRRAAQLLELLDPPPVVRLSRHFREAGDVEAWSRYAEASADVALRSGDDRTAVTVLHELLTTARHPSDRRARLARKLGETAFYGTAALGDLAERVVEALRDVLAEDDLAQPERGEIRLLLGRLLREVSQEQAAFDQIEAAIPDLHHRPEVAARAMLTLAVPLVPDWPAARHLEWLHRATELLPHVDSQTDRLGFTVNRATALLMLGEEAGWQAAAEIAQRASSSREEQMIAGGLLNVAELATVWGRYDTGREQLAAAVEHMRTSGYQRLVSTVGVVGAYLDWYTGAWERLGDTAAELARSPDSSPQEQLQARQLLGLLDLVRGAWHEAERHLHEVSDEYARHGVVGPDAVLGAAARGRLRLADGAVDEALHVTGPVLRMITRKGVWLWAADIAPVHVDALAGAGRLDEAKTLVEQFASWLHGRNATAASASLLTCRAIVAERAALHGTAAEWFAGAAVVWAALPRPYDELLALERRGRCLLAAGDEAAGLAVLSDAHHRLRQLGAPWDADRVAHLLRRQGVEVVRAWRRGPRGYGDRLSPRELEVVALVARGLTNRQIGEALFLSPKTVDRHLSAAMRKLGVSSRTAVAVAALEAGLLPPG